MKINEKFLSPYNPAEVESKIYKLWEESGHFNPDNLQVDKGAKPFSVAFPPPNVTGTLHTGHSMTVAIQDAIVRYRRMNGKKTLWVPGTDHAAIATQSVVEKKIKKEEGKNRNDFTREELMGRINDFAMESQRTILSQVRGLGASLDWSRLAFTLDEDRSRAVQTAFKQMYDQWLIYRGDRIVNWDPRGQTTISDDEVEHEDRKAMFYTFRYWSDFPIAISTTRPETKLGDTAVAVHPDDQRYKDFVGKVFEGEFCGVSLSIKIIADESVDPEFGTGALGVTPSHSQTDWDMADRHELKRKQVINEYAQIINTDSEFDGLKVGEARELVILKLREGGLLMEEAEIDQSVSTAQRTGAIIEPLPKKQWWIAVNQEFDHFGKRTTLKQLMHDAVKNDGIKIIPDRFEKVYFHWIDNLRDWCISRQIIYGHRIPIWYRGKDTEQEEIFCGVEVPQGDGWEQDTDTLDTWFSSGLWTFSTLGWPGKTKDMERFHPTELMETGYDILFFWIARMILFSKYLLNEIPFRTVYLHGLVRDEKGRKMSKSLGNVLDPRDLQVKFGTDALRMALIVANPPGNDLKLGEEKVRAYQKFANKLWNIARFVLENADPSDYQNNFDRWGEEDKDIIQTQNELHRKITKEMDEYKLYLVAEQLYHYVWHDFADIIVEESKDILTSDIEEVKNSRKQALLHSLVFILKSLHPFMPFITEEIWQNTFGKESGGSLMVQSWN